MSDLPPPPAVVDTVEYPAETRAFVRFMAGLEADLAHEGGGEDIGLARSRFDLGTTTRLSRDLTLKLEGRLRTVGRTQTTDLEPGRAEATAELGEAWVSWSRHAHRLDAGHLVGRWGVMDVQSPNDVLNPIDFRDGPALPGGATEVPVVPVPMLRWAYSGEAAHLEVSWLPFFVPHRAGVSDGDWAAIRLDPSLAGALSLLDLLASPSASETLQPLLLAPNPPEAWPTNGSLGARLGFVLPGADLHVQALWGYDRLPVVRVDPALSAFLEAARTNDTGALLRLYPEVQPRLATGAPLYESEYRRLLHVGADLGVALETVTLKAEVAATPNRTLYDRRFQAVRTPTFSWAAGLDWLPDDVWSGTLEVFGLSPFESPRGGWLLMSRHLVQAAGVLQWAGVDDVRLTLAAQVGVTDASWALAPSAEWSPTEGHALSAGVLVLEGPADTLFGLYDRNDAAQLRYTLSL